MNSHDAAMEQSPGCPAVTCCDGVVFDLYVIPTVPVVYLTDQNGNYITDENGNRIIL